METTKSNRTFHFGHRVEVKAIKAIKFPIILGNEKGIRTLSLLLSNKSMKTVRMLLNLKITAVES